MIDVLVNISRIHFPVTTLGPGRRLGIWFQGCSIRCPGCISVDTWDAGRGAIHLTHLLEKINDWLSEADGVTISGGEPFDQPDALHLLIKNLKLKSHQNLLVYSGFPLEKIQHHAAFQSGLIDALISEPFDFNADQTLALRGSDNQQLHLLTHKATKNFSEYARTRNVKDQTLDVMFDDDGSVWLAGIPQKEDMHKLQELLHLQGHTIVTTQDKRG